MSAGRKVRAFDYVNQPYEKVRDALNADALTIFQRATRVATSRAEGVAAALRVNLAGMEIGRDVEIDVLEGREQQRSGSTLSRHKTLDLTWKATGSPGLFPVMKAELAIYPLSHSETQIELEGTYHPPLGALGELIDTLVGHRIAEASVHRFVADVVDHLKQELAEP